MERKFLFGLGERIVKGTSSFTFDFPQPHGEKPYWGDPYWGEALLVRSLTGEKPYWGEALLGRSLTGEKPYWGETLLGRNLTGEKPYWGEILAIFFFHFSRQIIAFR